MDNQRQYTRFECDSECILMEIDGDTYDVLLENLSLGGALVKVSDGVSNSLQVGEMCGLMFHDNLNMNFENHTGKIVRLDSGSVGVSFHNLEHRQLKKESSSSS